MADTGLEHGLNICTFCDIVTVIIRTYRFPHLRSATLRFSATVYGTPRCPRHSSYTGLCDCEPPISQPPLPKLSYMDQL